MCTASAKHIKVMQIIFSFFLKQRKINIFLHSFLSVGSPRGLPLFDHLRSVFFSTHMYYDNIVRWRHMSNFQFTSIYPCSLSLLVVRFTKAFCFSASSSSFLKICREKDSAGETWNPDLWHRTPMPKPLDQDAPHFHIFFFVEFKVIICTSPFGMLQLFNLKNWDC